MFKGFEEGRGVIASDLLFDITCTSNRDMSIGKISEHLFWIIRVDINFMDIAEEHVQQISDESFK